MFTVTIDRQRPTLIFCHALRTLEHLALVFKCRWIHLSPRFLVGSNPAPVQAFRHRQNGKQNRGSARIENIPKTAATTDLIRDAATSFYRHIQGSRALAWSEYPAISFFNPYSNIARVGGFKLSRVSQREEIVAPTRAKANSVSARRKEERPPVCAVLITGKWITMLIQ